MKKEIVTEKVRSKRKRPIGKNREGMVRFLLKREDEEFLERQREWAKACNGEKPWENEPTTAADY